MRNQTLLWYKAWRESRLRFGLSAAIIAAMCLLYTIFHTRFYPGIVHDHPYIHTYVQYVQRTIFGGLVRGLLQLSCLLLGIGGLQRDRQQGSLGFTLALPVGRARLVVSRAAVGILEVLALAAVPSLIVTAASALAGEHLPLDYTLRFVPLWAAGGLFTFAVSFFASVLIPSEYVSLAASYVAYIFYLAAVRHPRFRAFHLHAADFMGGLFPHYLDRQTMLWTTTYPVLPILGFLTAALCLLVCSELVTAKQDF